MPRPLQRGQAIVLIAFMMVVILGFLGLAVDGGRAYLDRRELQAATDAAALAAAYNYMNNTDYSRAEQAAEGAYASNQRLYPAPSCSGYGSASASCAFSDGSGQVLTVTATDRSVAGVNWTATGSHRIPLTIMSALGVGTTIPVSATATAVARKIGSGGAAIQALSPACSGGVATVPVAFTGTSTTTVTGDIWSNGTVVDNGGAGGTVNGNVVDQCPAMPPAPLPTPAPWTVTGAQVTGINMPDPGYPTPPLISTGQTWASYTVNNAPGTYSTNPQVTGSGCFFLAPGVYDWAQGFKFNGGFITNELRPPDEQSHTTTTAAIPNGTVTSIPVQALTSGTAAGQVIVVGGQTFQVSSSVSAGATSIPVNSASLAATISSGAPVTYRGVQFWDSNGANCSGTVQPYPVASGNAVASHAWGIEVTAVRWELEPPNGSGSCGGPVSAGCVLRESSPSMCRVVDVGSGQAIGMWISNVPGAAYYNVYADPSGSCAGPFGYVTQFANTYFSSMQNKTLTGCPASWGTGGGSLPNLARNARPPSPYSNCDLGTSSATLDSTVLPAGWAPSAGAGPDTTGGYPPDGEGPPIGPGLPNSTPATNTWPAGDRANENYCTNSVGAGVKCQAHVAGQTTPGAVLFYIPGGGSNTVCLNLPGGGDIYVFTGYQYGRILLYEPGPLQQPPANTCANAVAGHGMTSLLGIFYIPAASVVITGNSGYFATIAGGVVAWTVEVKGTGQVSITADPTLRSWPSAVALIK